MAEHLGADADGYLQAAALNVAPPPLPSDALVDGATPVEQLLRVLGLASNAGDSADNADSAERHAERDTWTTAAAGAFTEQDAAAAQQIPAVVSSITGALGGAVSGLLQPLGQLPALLTQGTQQVLQATTSLAARNDPRDPAPVDDPADQSPSEPTDFGDIGVADPTVPAATLPAAALSGPPPASAATYPSASGPSASATAPSARIAAPLPGSAPTAPFTGMPMVPPAGLPTGGAQNHAEPKADTRRIAVGPVTNSGKPAEPSRGTAGTRDSPAPSPR